MIETKLKEGTFARKKAFEGTNQLEVDLSLSNTQQRYEGYNVIIVGGKSEKRSKTGLQTALESAARPGEYEQDIPSFGNVVLSTILDPPLVSESQEVMLRFWDLTGFEDYPYLRELNFPFTDIFILCFDTSTYKRS